MFSEPRRTLRYLYDKGDYDEMRKFLGEVDWSNHLQGMSVDEMWTVISNHVNEATSSYIPSRTIFVGKSAKPRKPIWMDKKIMRSLRKKVSFQALLRNQGRKRLSSLRQRKEYCKEQN